MLAQARVKRGPMRAREAQARRLRGTEGVMRAQGTREAA